MTEPIKTNGLGFPRLYIDGHELFPTSRENLYSDPAGDLYLDTPRSISEKDSIYLSDNFSLGIDKKTQALQINIPHQQLAQLETFAEKEGINPRHLPDIVFQTIRGEIYNPETKQWMNPEEIRNWGYQKLFQGNIDQKVIKWITEDPRGIEWYKENRPKILDNFKNNFREHAGAFGLSILSLMGMGALADLAGIEDPTLRLVFVLGPLGPIERTSKYIIQSLRGPRNVVFKGYRYAGNLFRPNLFAGPLSQIELPFAEAEAAASRVTARAVENNLVSIRFRLNGAGSKAFFVGLINQIFPAGETLLIRSGRTLIGVLKFPAHIFKTFLNLGCGIVTQTIWSQTLGKLIPSDFAWGIPKHALEIGMLFLPNMAAAFAPRKLGVKINNFANHGTFKAVGAAVIVDLGALFSLGIASIFGGDDFDYTASTYLRAAEKNAPFLKKIPHWIPLRMYLGTFIGALSFETKDMIEATDRFLSKNTTFSVKDELMTILAPDLKGKEWVDFADGGGFRDVSISFLKQWGYLKAEFPDPEKFKAFVRQLKLLVNLSGMTENEIIDDCIDDWFADIDEDDFEEEIMSADNADKELLDEDCEAKFLLWIGREITGVDCLTDEDTCNTGTYNWGKYIVLKNRRDKFAAEWIEKELGLLSSMHYHELISSELENVSKQIRTFGIDPKERNNAYWDLARIETDKINSIIEGSDFDPSILDMMSDIINRKISDSHEGHETLIPDLLVYALWLEDNISTVEHNLQKNYNALAEVKKVLNHLTSKGEVGDSAYDSWGKSREYLKALADASALSSEVAKLRPEVSILIKTMLKEIEEINAKGEDLTLHINQLRILGASIITNDSELAKEVRTSLSDHSDVELLYEAGRAIENKGDELTMKIVDSFAKVTGRHLIRTRKTVDINFDEAFETAWLEYENGNLLADVEGISKMADGIYKLINSVKSGIINKDELKRKVRSSLISETNEMKVIRYNDDLRAASASATQDKLETMLSRWYNYIAKIGDRNDPKETFNNVWDLFDTTELAVIKREMIGAANHYHFYIGKDIKAVPPHKDHSTIIKLLKEGSGRHDYYSVAKNDLLKLANFMREHAHQPYMNFITELMSGRNISGGSLDSLWIRNHVSTQNKINNEMVYLLGGEKDLLKTIETEIEPEIRDDVITAIYNYDDYGRIESLDSETPTPNPRNILKVDAAEMSEDTFVKSNLKIMKFIIAARVAVMSRQADINDNVINSANTVLAQLSKLEHVEGLSGKRASSVIEGLAEKHREIFTPTVFEIFNKDGRVKVTKDELFRYIKLIAQKETN